jgi:hypothetical protein
LDDRHGYIAPHGGRRGVGEVLVRQFGYATAARYLDNSEQMVRERYSHTEAGEQLKYGVVSPLVWSFFIRNRE